jgi:hypothetical protein
VTADTSGSAPRELASGPRSPPLSAVSHLEQDSTSGHTADEHAAPISGSPDISIYSTDAAAEEPNYPLEEPSNPVEHTRYYEEAAAQEAPAPRTESPFQQLDHVEARPQAPTIPADESYAAESQSSQSLPSQKRESVAAPEQMPAQATTMTFREDTRPEETHQANDAARRAPAVFHDEKIPVMAEPPEVRLARPAAPGMVATSGPLEDFPFR